MASRRRLSAIAATLASTLALTGGSMLPAAAAAEGGTETLLQHHAADLQVTATPRSTLTPDRATSSASAQTLHTPGKTVTGLVDTPDGITVAGLVWEGEDASASLRVRQADGTWGEWVSAGDTVALEDGRWGTDGLVLADADAIEVELTGEVSAARVETWTSAVTASDQQTVAELPPVTAGGTGLAIGTRDDWGADESLRGELTVGDAPKLGVTLHHTVTAPVYAPEEVPATLRTIYAFHGQSLGWGDIGYNILLDQHGRVWEGRAGGLEQSVQGAHAVGMNTDWVGLSVIGDHDVTPVAPSQHPSITATAAWVMNRWGIEAGDRVDYTNTSMGWTKNLSVFHGHRDVAATLCPGMHLVGIMDELQLKIAAEQQADRTALHRIGGATRYESAAELALAAAPEGVNRAFLAAGDPQADALGLAPVAALTDSAVLLSRRDSVPGVTMSALAELGVQEVVVVGGETAISPAVVSQLVSSGYAVRRVAGGDRYATAAMVSREMLQMAPPDGSGGTVYVANGVSVIDALGGAAAAAEVGAPMLLTRTGALPAVTTERLAELSPARVVVLGGPGVVGDEVVAELRALLPGARVDRVAGKDRYASSAAVALDAFGSATVGVFASGSAPADAMAGTQVAAGRGGPLLLVRPTCLPGATRAVVDELGIELGLLAGGSGVLGWGAGSQTC